MRVYLLEVSSSFYEISSESGNVPTPPTQLDLGQSSRYNAVQIYHPLQVCGDLLVTGLRPHTFNG